MKLKGEYRQKYIIDKVNKELVVNVVLKQRDGLIEQDQNVWYGIATVDDKVINHPNLPYCVNAEYMAETIGLEIIEAWKKEQKKKIKFLD